MKEYVHPTVVLVRFLKGLVEAIVVVAFLVGVSVWVGLGVQATQVHDQTEKDKRLALQEAQQPNTNVTNNTDCRNVP